MIIPDRLRTYNVTLRHVHLFNYCCSGKAVSITHSEHVFVALSNHAISMRHIVTCGLQGSKIFSHIISLMAQFSKKLLNTKCVFWFSLQILSKTFLILRRIEWDMIKKKYTGLHVKYRYYCPILMKTAIYQQIFEKHSNTKFHENLSNGSLAVPCRWMHRHGKTNRRFSQFYECT
jgi:hypothetical protein